MYFLGKKYSVHKKIYIKCLIKHIVEVKINHIFTFYNVLYYFFIIFSNVSFATNIQYVWNDTSELQEVSANDCVVRF